MIKTHIFIIERYIFIKGGNPYNRGQSEERYPYTRDDILIIYNRKYIQERYPYTRDQNQERYPYYGEIALQ